MCMFTVVHAVIELGVHTFS